MKRLPTAAAVFGAVLCVAAPASADVPIVGGTSFNDAAPIGPGQFSDALDSGSTVFYRLNLVRGEQLNAGASLDVSGLDASLTGTSSLVLRLYGPLRGQDAEAQTLGPGDSATHLKTTSATIGPVRQAGDYYVSAGVNDFLPQGNAPVQLPLALTIGIADKGVPATHQARASSGRAGTSWAVLLALCLGGAALGGAGGFFFTRR